MISSTLWLVKALEKPYETTVSMPIHYTNLPKNKVLVKAPPSTVQIKMKAQGFALLRHKIRLSINPINFNVREFTNNLMEKTDASDFKIISDRYTRQISRQISSEISILDITPDTLFFQFDNVISQKKKVKHNFDLSFENQYFLLDSISFTPDSVWVKGPKRLVDSIQFVYPKKQQFKELNSSIKRNISIESIDPINIDPSRVVVTIPVSQYTEYNQKISITKLNVPDSINLITFPGKIEVNCLVALNSYKNLRFTSFIVTVDYNDIDAENDLLQLSIDQTPGHIKSLKIYPTQVEYVIEKRQDD